MNILLCTLDSPGFYNPVIGLAKALEAQGHQAMLVANHRQERYFQLAGVTTLSVPHKGEGFTVSRWGNPEHGALQFKDVRKAIDVFCPDLIITQPMALGSIAAARCAFIPFVTIGQFSPLWQERHWQDPDVSSVLSMHRDIRARELCAFYLDLCRHLNLNDPIRDSRDVLGSLHLIRSVEPWLQERLPQGLAYAGGMLWEAGPSREIRDWLVSMQQQQRPIIYVQHGKRFGLKTFWEQLHNWSKNSGYAFALSTGRFFPSEYNWPSHTLCHPYIPQSFIFRQCTGAVLHGHTTSVVGALSHGIQATLLPAGGETVDNAIICSALSCIQVLDDWSEITFDKVLSQRLAPCKPTVPDKARGFDMAAGLVCRIMQPSHMMA
ncbi:hypothetical protein [Pseudoalteromonas sp. R3]|uniref:glycosyltransferase n=1 Tax=Pseudoalteromonas sp. R3 TaxID=1709477 RepID=UPI0006B415AF|nr:hypothetical protein [Pseudoalteromonas sp. R3]AZZ99964.1 hypothetical protein ELR70_24560 [Pseudoalteromonas sp. R3]